MADRADLSLPVAIDPATMAGDHSSTDPGIDMDLDDVRTQLPDWEVGEDGISRTFDVDDYGAAMGLAVQIALEAQRRNHHPDMTVTWGAVGVSLVTHDEGSSVTDKDVDLATWIDDLTA